MSKRGFKDGEFEERIDVPVENLTRHLILIDVLWVRETGADSVSGFFR